MVPPIAANLQVLMPDRAVYDGAGIGDSSYNVVARQQADPSRANWISVFWYGHNNLTDPARIKADMATSIATLSPGNDRFIILSLLNEATPLGIKGGPYYNTVLQLNAYFAATYPGHFIDVRTPLVQQYNPNDPQDVADFANDVPPTSIRFDEIHLKNPGSVLVCTMIRSLIQSHGW